MICFSLNIKICWLYCRWFGKTRWNLGKNILHPQKYALRTSPKICTPLVLIKVFTICRLNTNDQKLLCCFRVLKTTLRQDGSVNVRRFWLNLHFFHTVWSNEHYTNNGTSFRNHDILLVISASLVKVKTFWCRASSRFHFLQ